MQGGNGLAGVPGQEQAFAHALQLAIDYATALDVPRVNILAGKQPHDYDLLPCLNTLASNLKLACNLLSAHHIQPLIEMINGTDMPRFLIQNTAQAQEMLEAVHHPALKLQYDCYHIAMMGEDVLEELKENIHDIGHIQFADCPGRHQPDTGHSILSRYLLGYKVVIIRVLLAQNIGHAHHQATLLTGNQNISLMM